VLQTIVAMHFILKFSSADFQVCCAAGFQTCAVSQLRSPADLEVGDTAGLESYATEIK